ncbi:MAG: membrane dipeptidase [Lachnospiraceae bacterium]|jgi:membrane dipeptidase|nr:membrane dipeptidase [Lachnospiraceae bacterium]
MNVVDMHCDTIAELYYSHRDGGNASVLENSLHIDLKRMQKGQYLLQNFALFVHMEREKEPFAYAMKLVDTFYRELEAWPELIGIVKSWEDIEANRKAGRMSALLTLEEGGVCQGELAYLRDFYRLGARMMTLTWNFQNELASPNRIIRSPEGPVRFAPDTEHGLTPRGIEFVREMERLGMIIDVSHLGDAGIWDVFRYTTKPFVASHSNARSLASHPRNLTDDMIRALAERGGVAGINFCAAFLRDEEDGKEPVHSYCRDMVAHMKHMRRTGGIGCIGLGTDFDGITSQVELVDCSGMQMLADEMSRQGFTTGEIEAVFYGNVLRLYKELL